MKRLTEFHLLILALVGIILYAVIRTSDPASGSSQSQFGSTAENSLALRLWLEKSSYDVRELFTSPLPLDDLDALFVLDPSMDYTPAEAKDVQRWVTQGHTLVVAGSWSRVNSLLASFNITLGRLVYAEESASLSAPTLIMPPWMELNLRTAAEIETTRRDIVVHVFVKDKPVLASFDEGAGTVWVVGSAYPFFNYGLRDEASARLVMNLLSDLPPESTVGFDERQPSTAEESRQSGLNDWVMSTPAGWSLIVLIVLVMVFLLLRGRRFGRPQPILVEQLQREPTEYIQAVATLFRRSGQRGEVLRHYKAELLRWLANRYALEPRLNDDDVVRILAVRDSALDTQALADLLHDLSAQHVTEQQLVQIIMRVDGWIGEKR